MTEPLFFGSQPIYPSQLPSQPLLEEETLISQSEEKWTSEASGVALEQQALYRITIGKMVRELREKAAALKALNQNSYQIRWEINRSIAAFNDSLKLFHSNNRAYEQSKWEVKSESSSLADKFRSSAASFSVYTMPARTSPEAFLPFSQSHEQFQALEALAGAHLAGQALHLTGEIVVAGAKAACSITPATKNFCKSTLELGKKSLVKTLEVTRTKEIVKEALLYLQSCDGSSLAEVLVDRYGFPEEQAKQLASQHVGDLLVGSTTAATAGVGSLVFKGITMGAKQTAKHFAKKSARTATAAPQPSAPSHLPPPQLCLPKPESPLTATVATAPFPTRPRSNLYSLGRANDVESTMNRLYAAIDALPDTSLYDNIPNSQLDGLLPRLTPHERTILAAAKGEQINHGGGLNKISDGGRTFLCKKFCSPSEGAHEAMGLDILRSFELQHLTLPKPIAFGVSNGSTFSPDAFLLKTYLPGKTLLQWIEEAGATLPHRERFPLIAGLQEAALSAGRALGELQTKSSRFPLLSASHAETASRKAVFLLKGTIEDTHDMLLNIGSRLTIRHLDHLDSLIDSFNKSPGGVAAGFGDISACQFSWYPGLHRPFGLFDTGHVSRTVNASWQPLQLIAREYWEFHHLFLRHGYLAGLKLTEIKKLQQAFTDGYFAEYSGPRHTVAADNFYRLYHSFSTLEFIAQNIDLQGPLNGAGDFLNYLKHAIESNLLAYPQKKAASFQTTDYLTYKTWASPLASTATAERSAMPIAMRINHLAEGQLYFPPIRDFIQKNLKDLHAIWSHNQNTLIGILGEEPLPRFGFHGTTPLGVEGILSTRISDSGWGCQYIWVAGYRYPVNPVAQLADLLNMANKASNYMEEGGGIFTVDTMHATPCEQAFVSAVEPLPWDRAAHNRIFSLMQRDGKGALITAAEDGRIAIREDAFMNVGEYHVNFNPETYGSIVKGLLRDSESLYPLQEIKHREWTLLAKRFKMQELVIAAFDQLAVVGDFSKAPWGHYQHKGKDLLRLPKESMAVPLNEFIQVERHFAKLQTPARRLVAGHNALPRKNRLSPSAKDRRAITGKAIGNLGNVDLRGYISSYRNDMILQIASLQSKYASINPLQLNNQFIRFAKENGACRLFVELDLDRGIDRTFTEWIQRYPAVLKRDYIFPMEPTGSTHIFQIPLQ